MEGGTLPAGALRGGRRGARHDGAGLIVAVISDTHLPRGTRRLPPECLRRLDDADLILHGGDFTARVVLDELGELGRVEGVHGNMDDADLRSILPRRRVVELGDGLLLGMVHDGGPRAGREARLVASFPGCSAVVYGHSHLPQVDRHEGAWILNPGSPTERRHAPHRTMIELRVEGKALQPGLIRLP